MCAKAKLKEAESFSDLEAAKAAVAMEEEGLAFYRAAAAAVKNPELAGVFRDMAGQEAEHLAQFEDLAGEVSRARAAHEEYWDDAEVGEYIHAVIAQKVFPKPEKAAGAVAGMSSAADALRFALGAEKDTVLFYTLCADSAKRQDVRELFGRLAAVERKHVALVGRWLRNATG
jgi:rubrerythrin